MMPIDATSKNTQTLSEELPVVFCVRFESQVDQTPEALAVESDTGSLTYAQLERRANQIAHGLQASGVEKGDYVGVFLERDMDLVCALVGVLKAGAAFVVLDPRAPHAVLARQLATVPLPFLLTRHALTSGLPNLATQFLFLDDPRWWTSGPVNRPNPIAAPRDPACVLFTSGSRGHPKAVLYLHQNLAVRFFNSSQIMNLDERSVFAQTSPITSIDAIDEMFLPLVSGGRMVILGYETVTNPHQLVARLSAHHITHLLLVPSLLRVILLAEKNLDQKLQALTTWIVGGEQLPGSLTREFYRQLPDARLINFYGLTEGDAAYHITSPHRDYGFSTPIGRPVPGTSVYLLDEWLEPVPIGNPGEICLAGPGLFHEYVNCPELNEQHWAVNPFASGEADLRIFRTGDLGRLRPDGEIEYLRRNDRMVKVRGFRVELSEVDAMLCQHPAVEHGFVVAKQPTGVEGADLRHQPYLVAYAVLKNGMSATPQEIRDFLKIHLPEHALPARISLLDTFPLLPNGKIDVQSLAKAEPTEREFCGHYVAPQSLTEQRLTKVWEELLNYHPIGIADSFFDIGGDSLKTIDLMLTIEREFQCSLPITVLIQSPTIAALAEMIEDKGKTVSMACLVPIRLHGSRPPLFCIHADGSVFIYRRFAEYLDPEIPIFGLQAYGLSNPKDDPYRRVEDMAACYLKEIRLVQPHGPYHFCAFSAGGLIIFEMARQLQAVGEEVVFLGLLDAYGPAYPQYLPDKNLVDYKLSVHLNTMRLHGARGQVSYLWGRVKHRLDLVISKLVAEVLLKFHVSMPRKIRYEYVARLIDHAEQTYPRGRTYSGNATIFHAATQPDNIQPDRTLGWTELLMGGIDIIDVTGTHHSIMMYEPHVAELVRKIDLRLGKLHSQLTVEIPLADSVMPTR